MKRITCYIFFIISPLLIIFLTASTNQNSQFNTKEIFFLDINSDLSSISEYNIHFSNGVKLAVNEINDSGGINGKKITIIHRNDYVNYLTAKQAVVAYKNKNVLAVFGTYFTSASEGVSSGANEAKIPFLNCGYNDSIIYVKPSNYTYNLRPGLYRALKALALEASSFEDMNRWLIISYSNEEGLKASKFFEKQLILQYNNTSHINSSNNQIAFQFEHIYISPFKANQFLTNANILSRLRESKAVLIITNGKDLQNLLEKSKLKKVLANKIVFVPFAGEPEWLSYFSQEVTPEKWIVTGYPWYALNYQYHKEFYEKYFNTYQLQPRYASILGYIAIYMLANSAKKLNLNNPDIHALREEMNEQLSSMVLRDSPLGEIRFRTDYYSDLGIFTGQLYIYSQNIISKLGQEMLLKDIRMNNIKYYENSKISFSEEVGEEIRKKHLKIQSKVSQDFKQHVNLKKDRY